MKNLFTVTLAILICVLAACSTPKPPPLPDGHHRIPVNAAPTDPAVQPASKPAPEPVVANAVAPQAVPQPATKPEHRVALLYPAVGDKQ